jgi:hypothetical protein
MLKQGIDGQFNPESDETSIIVHTNSQSRPIIRSSILKTVQKVIKKLFFSQIQKQNVNYYKIFNFENINESDIREALHPCLKDAFEIDASLFIDLCQDLSIDEFLGDNTLSWYFIFKHRIRGIYNIHRHLQPLSRSLFNLERKIGLLDLPQALIIIQDKIKLNSLTTNPIATVTGIKSMKSVMQLCRNPAGSKVSINDNSEIRDRSSMIWSVNHSFTTWLKEVIP